MEHPIEKMIQNILTRVHQDIESGKLHYEPTQQLLKRQIQVADEIGSPSLKSRVFQTMGIIEGNRGNLEDSERYFQEALTACEKTSDDQRRATILCCLGETHRLMSNVETAASYFEQSRNMAEAHHDARLIIYNYCNEGQLWLSRGDIDRAITLLQQGITLSLNGQFTREIVYSLIPEMRSALAEAYIRQGNYELARENLDRALQLASERNQVPQLARVYQAKTLLAIAEGSDNEEVLGYFEQSKVLWQSLEAFTDLGNLCSIIGNFWLKKGEAEKAASAFEAASACYEKPHSSETSIQAPVVSVAS